MDKKNQGSPLTLKFPFMRDLSTIHDPTDKKRAKAQNLKLKAIHWMGSNLLTSLDLISGTRVCEAESPVWTSAPSSPFSWTYENFVKRRKSNMVWFRLIEKEASSVCVGQRKDQTDILEIDYLLRIVLNGYFQKNQRRSGATLASVRKFLNIEGSLIQEYEHNTETFCRDIYKVLALDFLHRCSVRIRCLLHDKYVDDDIIDPCSNRYARRFQNSVEEQNTFRCNLDEEELEKKIKLTLENINREHTVKLLTMSLYDMQIQELRERIDAWTSRYDSDYESTSNALEYKQRMISGLATKRTSLEVVLVSRRADIKAALAKIERIKAQKLHRAAEAKLLEMSQIKQSPRRRSSPRTLKKL